MGREAVAGRVVSQWGIGRRKPGLAGPVFSAAAFRNVTDRRGPLLPGGDGVAGRGVAGVAGKHGVAGGNGGPGWRFVTGFRRFDGREADNGGLGPCHGECSAWALAVDGGVLEAGMLEMASFKGKRPIFR